MFNPVAPFSIDLGQLHLEIKKQRAEYGKQILANLSKELTWSHIRSLMFIDDTLKRNFYIEMCKMEHWSVRQLNERIDSMLYERTAISSSISHPPL